MDASYIGWGIDFWTHKRLQIRAQKEISDHGYFGGINS
jgi:hypothetical protein